MSKRVIRDDGTSPFIVVNHEVYRAYGGNVEPARARLGKSVPVQISASRSMKSLAFLWPADLPHAIVMAWTSERK